MYSRHTAISTNNNFNFQQRVLIVDNYDSFTYNLVHLVEKITHQPTTVVLNDTIQLSDVENYDKIILSPGPGIPEEAGLLLPLIQQYATKKSILGVCLGHQAIAQVFGAKLINLSTVYHGVTTKVNVKIKSKLFQELPDEFLAGQYHSWCVSKENFSDELEITAEDENNLIMALHHKQYDIQGVQFHPESVLTPYGETIIKNWLMQ